MNEQPIKWYNKPKSVIILLVLFFPIGLYLMWKNQLWSNKVRWIVSIAFAVIVISNPGKNSSNSSFSSNKCEMEGCEREGIGWYNNKNPELGKAGLWGSYKVSDHGGYCSKDHASEDY
jgi:hypothetical protein